MIGITPDITSVTVVRHGVLRLTFTDGLTGELDVLDRMRGPVFAQARTPDGFARVTVDDETGTIVWRGVSVVLGSSPRGLRQSALRIASGAAR